MLESPCVDAPWTRQEAGWHTHPFFGGIVRERGGWWWYPKYRLGRIGPYPSLKQAMAALSAPLDDKGTSP